MRAYTDIAQMSRDLTASFRALRATTRDGSPEDVALSEVETFTAIALRVMAKTNPSKIRDCARTVEIQCRMDGKECI